MIRRLGSTICFLILLGVAWPCGPFVPTFNQVALHTPDGTQADWVGGHLGLLQPLLCTADLVVAWRWFAGVGLSAAEQKAVLGTDASDPTTPNSTLRGAAAWKAARAAAGAPVLEPKVYRTENTYNEIPIIGDHALNTAARTLNAHLRSYGKTSPALRSWLAAQDRVFAWELPEAAEASLPLRIRQDRAYQVAAAHFYRQETQAALEGFQAVAADAANPWRGWAQYAVARIFAKGLSVEGSDLDADSVLSGLVRLQADSAFPEIQGDAAALENRIRYQVDPKAFYGRLIEHLAEKGRGPGLVQDLEDLRWLRVLEPWTEGLKGVQPTGVHAWINLVQKGDANAAMAAYDGQPELPNLVAVLLSLPAEHARVEFFLKAAQQASLKPGPAYATLVSHRLRILVAQKRLKAAEALATEALAQPQASRWPSAFNLWSSVKLAQAPDLDGFAAHLGRCLASVDDGEWGSWSEHPREDPKDSRLLKALDPGAVVLLNTQVPLRQWEALLDSPHFPKELRPEWLEALWTRAALLGREDIQTRRLPELAKLRPTLDKGLKVWAEEKDPIRKQALAMDLVWEARLWPQVLTFREEAFQYGTLYARWAGGPTTGPGGSELVVAQAPAAVPESAPLGLGGYGLVLTPKFLDAAAIREGKEEAGRIPAPLTWFCEQALALAEARPKDPLAPEALSRAVRASRNANRDTRSAALVVKAFRKLHKDYPGTEAAKAAKVYH